MAAPWEVEEPQQLIPQTATVSAAPWEEVGDSAVSTAPWEQEKTPHEIATEKVTKSFSDLLHLRAPNPENIPYQGPQTFGETVGTLTIAPVDIILGAAETAASVAQILGGAFAGVYGLLSPGTSAGEVYAEWNKATSPYFVPETKTGQLIAGAFSALVEGYKENIATETNVQRVLDPLRAIVSPEHMRHLEGALYGIANALPEILAVAGAKQMFEGKPKPKEKPLPIDERENVHKMPYGQLELFPKEDVLNKQGELFDNLPVPEKDFGPAPEQGKLKLARKRGEGGSDVPQVTYEGWNHNQLQTLATHLGKDLEHALLYVKKLNEGVPENLIKEAVERSPDILSASNKISKTTDLTPEAWGTLSAGDIGSTLKHYIDVDIEPVYKMFAKVLDRLDWSDIKVEIKELYGTRRYEDGKIVQKPLLGQWNPETNTITISPLAHKGWPGGQGSAIVLLHELTHAAIDHVIQYPRGTAGKALKQQVGDMYDAYMKKYGEDGWKGTSLSGGIKFTRERQLHEFVAEIFSNQEMRKRLSKMPDKGPKITNISDFYTWALKSFGDLYHFQRIEEKASTEGQLRRGQIFEGEFSILEPSMLPRAMKVFEDIVAYDGTSVGGKIDDMLSRMSNDLYRTPVKTKYENIIDIEDFYNRKDAKYDREQSGKANDFWNKLYPPLDVKVGDRVLYKNNTKGTVEWVRVVENQGTHIIVETTKDGRTIYAHKTDIKKAPSQGLKLITPETPVPTNTGIDILRGRNFDSYEVAKAKIGDIPAGTKLGTFGISLTTASWVNRIKAMSKEGLNSPIVQWAKWAEDHVQTIKEWSHNNFWNMARDDLRIIYDLPKHKDGDIRKLVKTSMELERDSGSWFNGIDYWPDAKTLRTKGLTDREVATYQAHARLSDFMWSLLTKAAKDTGRTLPPRIPGWMPHIWTGMYRVKFRDKEGKIVPFTYATHSLQEMKSALHGSIVSKAGPKALKDAGLTPEPIQHPNFNELISDGGFFEMLGDKAAEMSNLKGATANQWKAILRTLEKTGEEGFLSHILERNVKPMAGHEFDIIAHGGRKNFSDLDIAKVYERVFDAVNTFATNARIVNEVWSPMARDGLLTNPDLREMVNNRLVNSVGKDAPLIPALDAAVKKTMAHDLVGVAPNLPQNWFKAYSHASVLYFLGGKFAFLVANVLQPTRVVNQYMYSKGELSNLGYGKLPSVNKAIIDSAKDVGTMVNAAFNLWNLEKKSSAEVRNMGYLLRKMIDLNAVEPAALDLVVPGKLKTLSKITGLEYFRRLEMALRSSVFINGYHYYKQMKDLHGWSEEKVLAASKDFTDRVMVGYSKDFNAPTIISKSGMAGNAPSLFMTYPAHEAGLLYSAAKGTLRGSNARAKAYYAGSLAGTVAMYAALGGVGALPLINSWDDIVFALNKWFDAGVLTSKELARKFTEEYPEAIRHTVEFGAVSEKMGINISGSLGSLEPSLPFGPVSSMTENLIHAMYLVGKGIGSPAGVSEGEKAKLIASMPTQWRGIAEHAVAAARENNNLAEMGDVGRAVQSFVKKMILEDNRYQFSVDKNFAKKYDRTDTDQLLHNLGLTSVKEADFNITQNIFQRIKTRNANRASDYLKALDEDIEFRDLTKENKALLLQELAEQGMVPYGGLEDYMIKRNIPAPTRQWMEQGRKPNPKTIDTLQRIYP